MASYQFKCIASLQQLKWNEYSQRLVRFPNLYGNEKQENSSLLAFIEKQFPVFFGLVFFVQIQLILMNIDSKY